MSEADDRIRVQQIAEHVARAGCAAHLLPSGAIVVVGHRILCHLAIAEIGRLPVWARATAAVRSEPAPPRVAAMRAADVERWQALITAWLETREGEPFSVSDVARDALRLDNATDAQRHRIGRLLRAAGYRQRSFQTADGPLRRWTFITSTERTTP